MNSESRVVSSISKNQGWNGISQSTWKRFWFSKSNQLCSVCIVIELMFFWFLIYILYIVLQLTSLDLWVMLQLLLPNYEITSKWQKNSIWYEILSIINVPYHIYSHRWQLINHSSRKQLVEKVEQDFTSRKTTNLSLRQYPRYHNLSIHCLI